MGDDVKWTEGQWSHDEDEIFAKTEGGYVFVADTKPLPGDEGPDMSEQEVANARLIAAAPCMATAIAELLRAADELDEAGLVKEYAALRAALKGQSDDR